MTCHKGKTLGPGYENARLVTANMIYSKAGRVFPTEPCMTNYEEYRYQGAKALFKQVESSEY